MFPLERPKTDVNIRSTGGLVLSVTPSVLLTAYINYTSHCKGLYLQTDGGMMTSFGQMYSSLIEWFLSSCGSLCGRARGQDPHNPTSGSNCPKKAGAASGEEPQGQPGPFRLVNVDSCAT